MLSVLSLLRSLPSRSPLCRASLTSSTNNEWWLARHPRIFAPFEKDVEMTELVRAIADAKEHNLHVIDPQNPEESLRAFELPNCTFPIGKGFGQSVLFIRSFYESLFTKIRSLDRSVLIGNPRLGKSVYQFYYLSRIFNPDVFGPLPPNHLGSTKVEFVIRQSGAKDLQIYNVERKEVVSSSQVKIRELFIFGGFDPATTLYLFDPEEYKGEPYYSRLECQAFATVSPDLSRYKEFCKNGAQKLYFPCWSLEDLKSAGRYLRDRDLLPKTDFYSEESIESRFEEFGGIFQHVFPENPERVYDLITQRERALGNPNLDTLLTVGDIEDPSVSHLLMQYTEIPLSGERSFSTRKLEFVSEFIKKEIMKRVFATTLDDRIRVLIRNDMFEVSAKACREIYEGVVPELLVLGTDGWSQRRNEDSKIEPLNFPKLKKIVECTQLPKIDEMEDGVIYKPVKENNPAVDFQFRLEGRLYGVDVTRRSDQKTKKIGPVEKWLKCVGITNPNDVSLVIVPPPKFADKFQVICGTEVQDLVSEILIWKLPPMYRL